MSKLILPVLAAAALAAPTAALACHGHKAAAGSVHARARLVSFAHGKKVGFSLGFGFDHGNVTKLSGTGTSFGSTSATATGTGFSATLATTWSSATTKTWTDNDGDSDDGTVTLSCAPATLSLTLNGTSSTITGKTCSLTRKDGTTVYGFGGRSSDGVAAFLKEDGATVTGVAFQGGERGVRFGWKH